MHLFSRSAANRVAQEYGLEGNQPDRPDGSSGPPKVVAYKPKLPKVVRPHFTPHQARLAAFEREKRLRKLALKGLASVENTPGRNVTEYDQLESCPPYTESYNAILRQTDKKDAPTAIRIVMKMKDRGVAMDLHTYNLLLDILADIGDDSAFRVYEDMKEEAIRERSPVIPDQATYTILIRACERSGAYDKAFQLFHEMKGEFGIQPDVQTFNTLIGFCVAMADERTASELFEEMKEKGIRPNVHTYNSLMNVFCNAPFSVLEEMFNDLPHKGITPNLRTYNSMMKVCQRLNDYDRVFMYFGELREKKIAPNVVTYNILLEVCISRLNDLTNPPPGGRLPLRTSAKPQQPQATQRKLSTISTLTNNRKPSMSDSTTTRSKSILATDLQSIDLDKAIVDIAHTAVGLFNSMIEEGLSPNTGTYNAVMTVLARAADGRVFDLFARMLEHAKRGVCRKAPIPPTATAVDAPLPEVPHAPKPPEPEPVLPIITPRTDRSSLGGKKTRKQVTIEGVSARSNVDSMKRTSVITSTPSTIEALTVGNDDDKPIEDSFIKPDLMTYTSLLIASEKMGLFEKAWDVFRLMVEVGIRPDKTIYMKMMDVCVLKADTDRANALFNECKNKQIMIDVDLYNSLMNVLAEARDPTIFKVFDEMTAANIKPNQTTINALLRACERTQDGARAFKIYAEMCQKNSTVKPDLTTYTILMDVCGHTKDTERVRSLLHDMQKRSLPCTITTYNRLMRVLASAQDPGVIEFFDRIRRDGPMPNLESYIILLKYYCEKEDEMILAIFEDLKRVGIEPDLMVYNIMLSYCGRIRDKRKSLKFFEELKVRGLVANIDTYNALMAVFAESGDALIFKVFEEMNENQIHSNPTTFSILIKHKKSMECLKQAAEQKLLLPELAAWLQTKESEIKKIKRGEAASS